MSVAVLARVSALGAVLCAVSDCANTHGSPANGIDVTAGSEALLRADQLPVARGGPAVGKRDPGLEIVALFPGKAMPTGLTVSREGRIFLSFPRWGDAVAWTAVELSEGKLVPFPDAATNAFDPKDPALHDPATHLVSVQSVVVDAEDRLWLLDPGSVQLGPTLRGAPKLWAYDLASRERVKAITFPNDVVLKKTYLNDVRFDLARGMEGTAFVTDSGAGGIIVIDLASGESWRRLDGHPSVNPTPGLEMQSEGEPFVKRPRNGEESAPDIRSDGIALSPDARTLYYSTLTSRDIWAVPTDALSDRSLDEAAVAQHVRKLVTKPSCNDGLICDAEGRLYSSDWEDQCIRRIDPTSGHVEVESQDERMLWPDTFALHGGFLYVTSNQLARQPMFHSGQDRRVAPYVLFRLALGGRTEVGER